MSINSIKMAMSASSYGAYSQKLTDATRSRLMELGIAFDSNISEQEGRALIQRFEAQKAQNQPKQQTGQNKSKDDLFQKALELAQKLGLDVDESTNFNKMLIMIENELTQRAQACKNNPDELMKLRSLGEELAMIQAQSTGSMGFDATNKALEKSLDMLSLYNQQFLNR